MDNPLPNIITFSRGIYKLSKETLNLLLKLKIDVWKTTKSKYYFIKDVSFWISSCDNIKFCSMLLDFPSKAIRYSYKYSPKHPPKFINFDNPYGPDLTEQLQRKELGLSIL